MRRLNQILGKTVDLKSAYRQLSLKGAFEYGDIAVKDAAISKVKFFFSSVLAFWSGLERVVLATTYGVLRRLYGLSDQELATSAEKTMLFCLTSWDWSVAILEIRGRKCAALLQHWGVWSVQLH